MKKISLYIHIPFCNKSKCSYCSFISFCNQEDKIDKYISSVREEMIMYSKQFEDYILDTIFIGGGTPSVLSSAQMTSLFSAIRQNFVISNDAEITVECNVDSLTEEKLLTYRNLGVNRISIGAQSLSDDVLSCIGRRHSAEDVVNAVRMIKRTGFENFNVDMMVGLPHQTIDDVTKMASFMVMENVPHVSCYSLILEEGTPLYASVDSGCYSLPSEDETVVMYDKVYAILEQNGIKRYEVSNFAVEGRECRHNLCYWQGGDYLGLGVSAHSYTCGVRFSNFENLDDYFSMIDSHHKPVANSEKISLLQEREEYIMLHLRTKKGINLAEFEVKFNENLQKTRENEIKFLISHNLININNGFLSIADGSFYVMNSIVLKLI